MELVTLNSYTLPHELAIHKSKLESSGIKCFTKDEMTVQVHNFYSNAIGGVKLQVMKQDVELATEILKEEFDLKTDYPETDLLCPNCGSANIQGKGLNGKLSLLVLVLTGLPIPFFNSKLKCFDCYESYKLKEFKKVKHS